MENGTCIVIGSYTFGQEGNCFSKLIPGDVVTHERLEYGMWTEDSKTTLDEPATAMAWSIQIRFQSSDSTRYPVSTSSTTASQTSVVAGFDIKFHIKLHIHPCFNDEDSSFWWLNNNSENSDWHHHSDDLRGVSAGDIFLLSEEAEEGTGSTDGQAIEITTDDAHARARNLVASRNGCRLAIPTYGGQKPAGRRSLLLVLSTHPSETQILD
ncbi:MAG: hypothetical protein M1816_004678 [Peltula sp. TS41687]|nr:MAG: hypothetical protein M1816_004678 [Peltula sp. TS41687]